MKWTKLNSSAAKEAYRDFLVVYAQALHKQDYKLEELPFLFQQDIYGDFLEPEFQNIHGPYRVGPGRINRLFGSMTISKKKLWNKNPKTLFLYDGLSVEKGNLGFKTYFNMITGKTNLVIFPLDQTAIDKIAAADLDVADLQKKYDADIHDQEQILKMTNTQPPTPMGLEGHYVDFLEGYIRRMEKRDINLKKRPFEKVESLEKSARIIPKGFDLNLEHQSLYQTGLWFFIALPGNRLRGKGSRPVFNMNDFTFHGTKTIPVSTRMLAALHKRGLNIEPIKERLNISRHEFEQALVEIGQNQNTPAQTPALTMQLIEQVEALKTVVENL